MAPRQAASRPRRPVIAWPRWRVPRRRTRAYSAGLDKCLPRVAFGEQTRHPAVQLLGIGPPGQQAQQGTAIGFGVIVGTRQEAGLAMMDQLGDAADVRRDDRKSGGPCLEQDVWQAVPLGGVEEGVEMVSAAATRSRRRARGSGCWVLPAARPDRLR